MRLHVLVWAWLAVTGLGLSCARPAATTPGVAGARLHVVEQRLGLMPKNVIETSTSADGRHVAFVTRVENGFCVVLDGQAGPQYESIGGYSPYFDPIARRLVFSPDGKRLAYAAKKDGKEFVVIDGQAGPQ